MKVLMPVYNDINYDGRVQRIANVLSAEHDVLVYSLAKPMQGGCGFQTAAIDVGEPQWKPLKYLALLWFWVRFVFFALRFRPDVVHAHDYFMSYVGWLAAKLTGALFVYDAHELIIPGGDVSWGWRDRFFYALEKAVVVKANLVVVANGARGTAMCEHYALKQNPLLIQNIPPMPQISESQYEEVLSKYPKLRAVVTDGTKKKFVYQGDVNFNRGLDLVIEAMQGLPRESMLLIFGGGPDAQATQDKIHNMNLEERVMFMGKVPRQDLEVILRFCDVGVVTYPMQGLNNLYCAPNKVFEYAQAGLAIAARANPTLDELMSRYHVGVSHQDVEQAMSSTMDDLPRFQNNLLAFLKQENWERESEKLIQIYKAFQRSTGSTGNDAFAPNTDTRNP